MKKLLPIVTLCAVLSACATSPRGAGRGTDMAARGTEVAARGADVAAASEPRPGARNSSAASANVGKEVLPNLELTEELLFKLLSAEFANQRGDWKSAYLTQLTLAQQTRDPRLARRATETALAAKKIDEALKAVRVWRGLAPRSDEAVQYYLSLVLLSDNLAEAKPLLEQRLKEARPTTRGLMAFQIQRMLLRAKDKAAAFKLLEDVLTPYLAMPEAHLALAHAAFANGETARARQEAELALKAKPDSELAALTLAQVIPDKAEASRALAEFLAAHPKSREVRQARARLLVDQKKYEQARQEFNTLLKERPEDLSTLYALGVLSAQLNDSKTAEQHLTKYVQLLTAQPEEERDPSQAFLLLAQIAEERKDTEAALKWLAQIEPGENYLRAQIKRAQLTAKRSGMEAARDLLQQIKADGEREETQLIVAEAQLLREANQLQEAMGVIKRGLERYPKNTDLLYDLAMLAEKAGQFDLMESTLRRVIELAPENQHAYNALGYSLADRNIRLQEAFTLIEKALKLAPDDPFIMDSMGWVQFRLGRLKEAETLLRRAYELRPDAEIATHLGEVLWVKGQKEDAQKFWRDAQTRDPQNDTLKSTLARFNVKF